MGISFARRHVFLTVAALALRSVPVAAAEVNGIWTEAATKDLGELTGNESLKNWKLRAWIEGYYVYNTNQPHENTVNINQALSIVKGTDVSIEGRTFDIHDSDPYMSLMEVELEKVPQLSGWLDPAAFGLKIDVDYGDTPDTIFDTIRGGRTQDKPLPNGDLLDGADRWLQHYSIGYVAPVGRGLRLDFGKLVTHIGGETIESIKNNNFSHGYLYSYAIPFQDTGLRVNYPWSDTFYTEFYVLQGWNVTWQDNNDSVTVGPSIGWAPNPRISMYASYLVGPEQRDNDSNERHLIDLGVNVNPVDPLNIFFSFDYGLDKNAIGSKDAKWAGFFTVFRYKLTGAFEPAVRLEYLSDPQGFATGVDQKLFGMTLTLNYRFDLPYGAHLLLRPEYRWDHSNEDFFTKGSSFRSQRDQHTIGLGAVLYY